MNHPEMLTEIDVCQLADAFPASLRSDAVEAGRLVRSLLDPKQWAYQESHFISGEEILIPHRLRFSEVQCSPVAGSRIERMVACLQTQSCDGFHRQRALQLILSDVQPWSAPFVVALIGEYVIEIIEDIAAATSRSNVEVMVSFISENPAYWEVTKQRVVSYWDVYYRHEYTKRNYPGFLLVRALESELRANRA